MREGGGAGAQEWEGGGLDALRGAGGWGRGLEGEAPEATGEYPFDHSRIKKRTGNLLCSYSGFKSQIVELEPE